MLGLSALTAASPADARILRPPQPGMELQGVELMADATDPQADSTANAPAASATPAPSKPANNDKADPPSDRVAAAKARAARALAEEGGSDFDATIPTETDLVEAAEEARGQAVGQAVSETDQRRKSASKSSASCVAGC